jgi:hypothetical protein
MAGIDGRYKKDQGDRALLQQPRITISHVQVEHAVGAAASGRGQKTWQAQETPSPGGTHDDWEGEAMTPTFSIRPDNTPAASWDDPGDPRVFLAQFLGSEVHLALYKADEFLQAVTAVERGEVESWHWCGNSFTVELGKEGCTITDHWWEPDDPFLGRAELTLPEFRSLVVA